MGRPPCCQTIGIKKGPWTPEEDIILVSYIHQHGPGNWRSVPNNTGIYHFNFFFFFIIYSSNFSQLKLLFFFFIIIFIHRFA